MYVCNKEQAQNIYHLALYRKFANPCLKNEFLPLEFKIFKDF